MLSMQVFLACLLPALATGGAGSYLDRREPPPNELVHIFYYGASPHMIIRS
jgi:hypothetical protein